MAPIKTIVATFVSTKLLFDMWVMHHRMPQFIISDKNAKFTTGFWKHLFQEVGMKLSFSMVFHPLNDGQIESINMVLN
jgi:hypothetical protein